MHTTDQNGHELDEPGGDARTVHQVSGEQKEGYCHQGEGSRRLIQLLGHNLQRHLGAYEQKEHGAQRKAEGNGNTDKQRHKERNNQPADHDAPSSFASRISISLPTI